MDKIINVHFVTPGHLPEAMLFREIAKEYGVQVRFNYGSHLENIGDWAVFGVPKDYHNMASARPFIDTPNPEGDMFVKERKLCRVSYIAPEDTNEHNRSKAECKLGIHIACRFLLDIGFDNYVHPDFVTVSFDEFMFDFSKEEMDVILNDSIMWFDFETSSLDPFTGEVVSCAVWFDNDDSTEYEWPVYFFDNTTDCKFLIRWMVETQIKSGAANAKFEQKWVIKYADGGVANIVADAQVDYALLFEESAKSLDIMAMLVGWEGYSLPMHEFLTPMNKHRTVVKNKRMKHHEAPMRLLKDYNCKDTYVTGLVSRVTQELLRKEPGGRMRKVARWLVRGQTMLARMEMNGMCIDKRFLVEKTVELRNHMDGLKAFVQEVANEYDMDDFNLNSAPQKKKLLFDCLDYPVFKLTNKRSIHKSKYKKDWWKSIKTNKPLSPSTDGESIGMMLDYLGEDPLLEKISEYNTLSTTLNTFILNFENALLEGDGRMRSNFSLTKLVTGQLSSTEPPMQNIPKNDIRKAFISRFKGGHIMEIDYSQLHLRIIGNLAQCEGFEEAYGGGVDLHSRTAAKVIAEMEEHEYLKCLNNGDKGAKEDRQTAKRTNFSIIFEIGARALASKTGRTEEECKRIIENWFYEYPEIAEQIERQHEYAEKHGYVISPFGRVRHLPNAQSLDKWLKLRTLRQAGDFLVSNSGRYMTMYGMILLDDEFARRGLNSVLVLQVHDSIVLDVDIYEMDEVLEIVQKCMITDIMDMCSDWMDPIKLEMDGFSGPNWHTDDAELEIIITEKEEIEIKEIN